MGIEKYFTIIEQMDQLIQMRNTGSPTEFMKRLGIGHSWLYEYLDIMRSLGAKIKYDRYRKTYYYENKGMFDFHFQEAK